MPDIFSRILRSRPIKCKNSFWLGLVVLVIFGVKIFLAGEYRHLTFILQGFQKALSDYHARQGDYPRDLRDVPRFFVALAGENFYFDSASCKEKDFWHGYQFQYQSVSDSRFIFKAAPRLKIGLKEFILTENGIAQ